MRRKRPGSSGDERKSPERGAFDRSHSDDIDFGDLDRAGAPESDLEDFGDSGTRGFADAWDDAATTDPDDGAALAASFGSDEDDSRGRDLDRRSRLSVVLLACVVVLGAVLAAAVQQGWIGTKPVEELQGASAFDSVILAPGAQRTYEAEPTSVNLVIGSISSAMFRTGDDMPPALVDGSTVRLPESVSAGPLIWAGRLHVAVLADEIGLDEEGCVVVTLIDSGFVPIDIAGQGRCGPELEATGDRLACRGDDLLLLEVWAGDPSSPQQPPPVAAIRFRAQATDGLGGTYSRRGTFSSGPGEKPLLEVSPIVGGVPGGEITVTFADGAQRASCTLIDRSGVSVKLLTS